MFPNETPWPGLNYRTSDLMPGLRREFQKNDRLATHTALGELFIPDEFRKCKWGCEIVEAPVVARQLPLRSPRTTAPLGAA